MNKRIALLIDSNNLAMRAIHAAKHSRMSAQGTNTGPLTIYINSLVKIIQDTQPRRLGIAWDGGMSKMRFQLSGSYKENRIQAPDIVTLKHDSFRLMKELLFHLGIEQIRVTGYEADDVIACWWQRLGRDEVDAITIVSSDKDFLQLLGANPQGVPTELLRLSSGEAATDRWTEERMLAELGYEPRQWPLVAALAGDRVDNVIGIPGVGVKTALKLLRAHDWQLVEATMDGHTDHLKRVLDNFLMVNLRDINMAVEVPFPQLFCPRNSLTPELEGFLDAYQMITLKGKVVTQKLWDKGGSALPGRQLRLPLPGA